LDAAKLDQDLKNCREDVGDAKDEAQKRDAEARLRRLEAIRAAMR
jgi:hypothetical protein